MNLTRRYSTARGIRFPQHEIAGVGADVLRENSLQPMGGEILGGHEVGGGGYFEPREPVDIGDLAQEAAARRLAAQTRGAFFARHILAGLGEPQGMPLPMYAAGGPIPPGGAGIVGEDGPEVVTAHPVGGARVIPLRAGLGTPGGSRAAAAPRPMPVRAPAGMAAAPALPDLAGTGLPASGAVSGELAAPGFYGAPPEETTAQDRYAGDLAHLSGMQMPEEQPAHGWRRVLADMAGIGYGLAARNPAAGIALHNYIEQRPFEQELAEYGRQRTAALAGARADEQAAALEQRENSQAAGQYDRDLAQHDTEQYRQQEAERQQAAEQAREQEAAGRLGESRQAAAATLAERTRHDRAAEAEALERATHPRAAGVTPDAQLAAAHRRELEQQGANTRAVIGHLYGAPSRAAAEALLQKFLGTGTPFDAAGAQKAINERFPANANPFDAAPAAAPGGNNPFGRIP